MSDKWTRNADHISWCPGCGNFGILNTMKEAFEGMGLDPRQVTIVSGIGQAGKTPHYLRCNMFNGLHGRALPLATGIKVANPGLTVIAQGGDGDMYGEGGNHLLHTIRRNPDITVLAHNNMVYGLTKGQASPTSGLGMVTPLQVHGVSETPLNPLALAISQGISFAARAFAGDKEGTRELIALAMKHRGLALVDIFQPCVTFNKVNTWDWFSDNTYTLEDHDTGNRAAALELALDGSRLALGVFFRDPDKTVFEDTLAPYLKSDAPLYKREVDREKLAKHIRERGL